MRAQNRIRAFPRNLEGPRDGLLSHFSECILELSPGLAPSDLVRIFATRVTELFHASGAAVILARGDRLELASVAGIARTVNASSSARLARALASRRADAAAGSIVRLPAAKALGRNLAETLGWSEITLAPLAGNKQQFRGLLCLIDPKGHISESERPLLEALCRHLSVLLENAQLFSRIEHSRKSWVEDFDAITDFIVVHSAANIILRVNRPLANFLEVPLTSLIGKTMDAVRTLSDRGQLGCPFCGRVSSSPHDSIHKSNGRVYLVSNSRLSGTAEEEERTVHVLKDITDRQELERRYRELFDNIQEGLFFCTPAGKFLEVNQALVRMLGYDNREELLRVNLFEQLCLRPNTASRLKEIERTGPLRNHEEILRRKDGALIYTLQNLLAVRDSSGQIVQYRGLMLDVTEQKTFQIQLQRERDFNRNILNNTQSMIFVLDTAGLVSYANRRCFEAGHRAEALLGRPLVDLVAPSQRTVTSDALNRVLSGIPVDNLELSIRNHDGRLGQFSVSLSPMRDEQGKINSIVIVMTDITDAAALQAKLQHTEKMAAVGQLVSGVAHEVNNPLAAIVGFTDLLLENPQIPPASKEDLRVILREAQRTKVIVQDLLSFAREVPAQRETISINAILRQTAKLRAYDLSKRGIEVNETLDEDLPPTIGDSHQLQQVFLNILNNAYDAILETGRPGRIDLRSLRKNNHVEIVFRDNGPGIIHADRIFEPFFTTKEVGKGTGLGLSICYGIVRAHRGEILCHNNSDGPGATFIVRLPFAEPVPGADVS